MFEYRTVCKQPSIKRLNFIRVRCRPIVGDQIQTPNHHHYHGLCLIFLREILYFFFVCTFLNPIMGHNVKVIYKEICIQMCRT